MKFKGLGGGSGVHLMYVGLVICVIAAVFGRFQIRVTRFLRISRRGGLTLSAGGTEEGSDRRFVQPANSLRVVEKRVDHLHPVVGLAVAHPRSAEYLRGAQKPNSYQ